MSRLNELRQRIHYKNEIREDVKIVNSTDTFWPSCYGSSKLFLDTVLRLFFKFGFQTQEINRVFTADAEEPEVVFCVAFTQLEHRS